MPLRNDVAVRMTITAKDIELMSFNGRNPIGIAALKAGVVGGNFNNPASRRWVTARSTSMAAGRTRTRSPLMAALRFVRGRLARSSGFPTWTRCKKCRS